MAKQLLRGLTIVVTRPRDQAAQLAQSIENAGGIPLLFPLLDITAVQDDSMLKEQISRLHQYNLAIFISPNAVKYGLSAIRAAGASLPPNPSSTSGRGELKIATVGQGSAKALRESGITNVIAPADRFDSEGLLALPELQNVSGWRVMIFRGDGGRELLGDTLKARGATVEYATSYQRSKPQQDAGVLLAAKPDAIIVTSSEALGYLWELLNDSGRAALRNTALFVPHARIAGLAREQGWLQVHVTASGDDGMLSALITWAHQRS
jgi:uroporphyrinogen-III synthase